MSADTQLQRARFEEWAADQSFAIGRDGNDEYLSEDTFGAWEAWQHLAALSEQQGVPDLARAVRNLRARSDSGASHHGQQWAHGVRFAANQIEALIEAQGKPAKGASA